MSASATTASAVAEGMLCSGKALGIDEQLLVGTIRQLSEDDLCSIASVIEACEFHAFQMATTNTSDTFYSGHFPGVLAWVLAHAGPTVFMQNLSGIEPLVNVFLIEGLSSEIESTQHIGRAATEFLTYPPIASILTTLDAARLGAIVSTVSYRESESFSFKNNMTGARWSSERIRASIDGMLPHLYISTAEDAERMMACPIGKMFRESYVIKNYKYWSVDREFILKYPDSTIEKLHEACENSPDKGWKISSFLIHERTAVEANEAISFITELPETTPAHWGRILGSLRASRGMPYSTDYSEETNSVRDHCAALITVMAAAASVFDTYSGQVPGIDYDTTARTSDGAWFLTDERLVRFLGENPERAHEVAAFVSERCSLDFDLLVTVINASTPALGGGML